MLKRKLALAAMGLALLAASPAFAQPPHWAPAHGWRAQHHHPHYYPVPAYVYYPAGPVVVAPPAYYYYAPPRPVIYGQIPVSRDLRVGFALGL